ncbi:Gfo/Idh/MocA family oxidoreductase [Microbacterium sp. PRC9]|uniref:Gfo/Idh/MocA family protein n=1 Tax=Microbacterium sp. PRC9 TaxID=2962591 RepID=UPI002881DED2|nr:Gfo/Idh/MocA family oxidoreductase [Microbacterium sp. PRC9]MDT0141615.1 Gfo/Idh/MocA family oxidoreductase [Microbacterium sp. PRC9]
MTTEVIDTVVGTVRTGLVGGGFMGRVHAAAARRAGARLASVASSSRDRAEAVARELRVARVEDDAAGVIAASDVDVVHICTPNATHAVLAEAALAAGKHVVCEKPLATSVSDARALARHAAATGSVAAVPFVYRYHPMVREARARVASGRIGTLLSLDGSYLQDWMLRQNDDDWRADAAAGGPSRAFADIGSHLCDLVEFVTGERIARVAARTRRVFDERAGRSVTNEDVAALLVETESGALGTLLVSQMAPGRKNALVLELHGTRRSLRFDQERPEELWVGARKGSRLVLRDPAADHPDSARLQTVPAGHPMGYQDAFDGFVADVYAAIGGAQPDGMPTFADGLRAAVLTAAVLESAQTRTWIEVPA